MIRILRGLVICAFILLAGCTCNEPRKATKKLVRDKYGDYILVDVKSKRG